MPKKQQNDEDWTAGQSSSKQKPPPQPSLHNCILHGYKGTVNDKFILLSSKADPLGAFTTIHDMKKKLQTQTFDCGGMQDVVESIPDELSSDCGYHKCCQRMFFRNATRALSKSQAENVSMRQTREHVDSSVLFGSYCIFCRSSTVKQVSGNRYSLQKFKSSAYKNIEKKAMELSDEDLLRKIRGVDLFAKEAQFHECCRKQYMVKRAPQSDTSSAASEIATKKALISTAFTRVHDHIKTEVIEKGQVVKLAHLTALYNETLTEFRETAVAEITSHNLRQKIECCPDLKDCIDFSSCPFKDTFLFCNSLESMKTTVRSAYELGITDWCKEVSHDLHKKIVTAFKTSEPLPWPPRAHDLHDPNEEIPPEVLRFILNLICGDKKPSYREESLASSISQDICRAVTSGQWKMKKHILLCMTLRHLFRSKSITTLINRLGHCESYTYSIELETALANSIVKSASLVSNSDVIKRQPDGAVFHSDWDNFDQLVSNVYGAGSIHAAAGIYMQDLGSCEDAEALSSAQPTEQSCVDINTPSPEQPTPNTQLTKKQRSFKSPATELPTYYKRKRSEPTNLVSSSCKKLNTYSQSKLEPEKYQNHIILIGTFHCCGAYLKGIGRRYCQGSGWVEVALEAKLITTGSVAGVTDGKNWDRAMNTHKSMLEALERLLYDKYLETHEPLSPEGTALLEKLTLNESTLTHVLSLDDVGLSHHMAEYHAFREAVRCGELGETGQFWMEYIDCVWLVLSMNKAIKMNDYEGYKAILNNMPDLFFCSDQQNYARFLTYLGYFLKHVEKTHPGSEKLLRAGAISVSRSQIPGNRCHTDKTIEETAMKWLKSNSGSGTYSAGICGITSNYEASQRHILTAHAKGEFVEAMWEMTHGRGEHTEKQQRDLRPREITRSEEQKALVHLLLNHWSSQDMMENVLQRPVIFIEAGQAYRIECNDGVMSKELLPEICSKHEETDVRVIIYMQYITTKMPHIRTVRVRAKDSDIFFILLYYAKSSTVNIIFDMGDRLINISQLAEDYSQDHISALLALHAFTGADCTSAFKGKGKVQPMKILNQNSKFIQVFAKVGNSWELDEEILSGVEEFTCRLYGFSRRIKKVDEAREIKVKKVCGSSFELRQGLSVDLSTFPPCRRVLLQHMKRVNFQVCIWKRAHEHYPEIPCPLNHGFHVNTETGKLEPLWFEGDVIPKALVDVLAEEDTDEDDLTDEIHTNINEDEEEEENDD
ncbi:hypothetical protein ACEWY4_007695 [Coilia grayii]|uniref:Uncharacterized protein n=1 Tax=Coilia grayii TaxID=363190 RepID=A0ABD1K8S6_9TELE